MDLGLFHFGADQRLAGQSLIGRLRCEGRLASRHRFVDRLPDDRFFLGNVELLLLPQMDLPSPLRGFSAHLRNAPAGIWRLPALLAGVIRDLPFGGRVLWEKGNRLYPDFG